MFGSKLRSWMENHIVRPRKKGAKNKNANGTAGANVSASCSHEAYNSGNNKKIALHHGYGNGTTVATATQSITANNCAATSTTCSASAATSVTGVATFGANHHNGGGCTSVISSPVRRREVSPIQGHTQSRYGWQSPDQEAVTSPKSDNFLYAPPHRVRSQQQQQQSHHGCQQLPHSYTAPNSKDNSSDDRSASAAAKAQSLCYGQQLQQQQQQPQPQISQQQSQLQPHPADCSSSSISSLSWSTGSKEPSMNSNSHNNSNSNNSNNNGKNKTHMHARTLAHAEYSNNNNGHGSDSANDMRHYDEQDANAVQYEEICTILRHPQHYTGSNSNNNNNINGNNSSNPFLTHERPKSEQLTTFTCARTYYSERQTQDDASTRYGRLLPSKIQSASSNSFDNLPASNNAYVRGSGSGSGSAEYIAASGMASLAYYQCAASAGGDIAHAPASLPVHAQRSRLRGTRFGNAHALNGNGSGSAGLAPSAAPLHSLSSPESAYSTGYSTDGTSPGAIYTPPEYYINMRTGTHYFPKSINSLAIEAQRYKFGLNKIEEMSPIDPLPKTSFANATGLYKRADSCDMGQVVGGAMQPHEQHLRSQEATAPQHANVGRHSPLALRNAIVLPTLKGFESPSPRQRCRIRTNPWYSSVDAVQPIFVPPPPPLPPPPSLSRSSLPAPPPPPLPSLLPAQLMSTSDTSTISSSVHSTSAAAPPEAPATMLKSVKTTKTAAVGKRRELDANNKISGGTTCIKSSHTGESRRDRHHSDTKHSSSSGGNCSIKLLTTTPMAVGYETTESSSSLTEVENMQRTCTPNTVRRKRAELLQQAAAARVAQQQHTAVAIALGGMAAECREHSGVSDDDATLNEMMGKFDESYVYEKETDILSSDSDPTDCPTDLDTGLDAGDECDTDELLDIDFIDTSSMQEVSERKDVDYNLGSCSYYCHSPKRSVSQRRQAEVRVSLGSRRSSRNAKVTAEAATAVGGGLLRRRKRFLKTRKKSAENRDPALHSPRNTRQSRSVGGTPVCLRRNQRSGKYRIYETSPLSNRSSSLVFTDARASSRRFMTIAESERVLLKADLEADVKYRKLIQEAESILVSMKNSLTSIPRDTPVASPRRVNPLANKRVEMLKHCESETRREQLKQSQQCIAEQQQQQQQLELAAAINRRIELLRHEPASAPNSPKFGRCSPRKTHLTNFINQNAPPEVPLRKSAAVDVSKPPQSPQLQLNGRRLQQCQSPTATPPQQRRFRSQSPVARSKSPSSSTQHRHQTLDSDSESDGQQSPIGGSLRRHRGKQGQHNALVDAVNHNYLPEFARLTRYDEADLRNHNVVNTNVGDVGADADTGAGASKHAAAQHWQSTCPQSEPLKRKVYNGSATFERIKQSFDLESEIPKQAMLAKIHNLRRRERQNSNPKLTACNSSHDLQQQQPLLVESVTEEHKKQRILSTIADLKRSLETQSVELNGLNED